MFEEESTEDIKYKKSTWFHFDEKTKTEDELLKETAKAKEHFDWISKNSHKPYLVTLRDCEEKELIGENSGRYTDAVLNQWAIRLLDNIDGTPVEQKTLSKITENVIDNNSYHACKIMYLIDQYRTVGLDSTIQGTTESKYLFVHPGMSRIHALWFLKAREEKIVVWDNVGHFENKATLRFDEWAEIFNVEGKTNFYTNIDGNRMECHMQEDRPSIAGSVELVRTMFDRKLPVIFGNPDDDVKQYVRTEGSTGVAIETKNDYTLKLADLTEILGLYPVSCERIEKENFNIYKI